MLQLRQPLDSYVLFGLHENPSVVRMFHTLYIARQSGLDRMDGFIQDAGSRFGTKLVETRYHAVHLVGIRT